MDEIIKKNNTRAYILNYPIDLVNMENAVDFIEDSIKSIKGGQVITINPEMIIQATRNPKLSRIIEQAELIIPDGTGIILALKKLGIKDISQIPGIEFSEALIQRCVQKNYAIGFLGASKDIIENVIKEFKIKYQSINIVFMHDGYFDEEEELRIIDELKISKPQVLFVALGVPKQELWIAKHKQMLSSIIMIGVGGSFDIWAKKIKRAPEFFRKFGLEWLFRLISQPSRFKRMFPSLPLFFIKIMFDNKSTSIKKRALK
ncbi:MAG: WecB/TagA/CpsF family glycosyltransferase [bacterium]